MEQNNTPKKTFEELVDLVRDGQNAIPELIMRSRNDRLALCFMIRQFDPRFKDLSDDHLCKKAVSFFAESLAGSIKA